MTTSSGVGQIIGQRGGTGANHKLTPETMIFRLMGDEDDRALNGEKACYNNAMIYEMRRDEIPATGAGKRGLRKEGR